MWQTVENITFSWLSGIVLPSNLEQWIGLLATLICYFSARYAYRKMKHSPLLQPMLIATTVLIAFVAFSSLSLNEYQNGSAILTWMIAPITIALMVPLAQNIREIKNILPAIIFTLLVCGTFTVLITVFIAHLLGASEVSLMSLSTKSVTTPVALIISEQIGSLTSLAVLIVIVTGIIGVVTAPMVYTAFGIKDDKVKGITLGLSAHIIGSTYALEQNHRYGAFSVVSMSLTALITALLLPLLIQLF